MYVSKILLVDDDKALVKSFSSILQKKGYYVETAMSGEQTLKKAKKTKFNLAILDIKLPDIMGDVVAKTLREQDNEIVIILITGYSSFQDSIDALNIGIYDILLKPIGPEELLRVTRDALSQRDTEIIAEHVDQLVMEEMLTEQVYRT